MHSPRDTGEAYLQYCRRRFLHEYFPRIRACLQELEESDVWWRPNEESNSIGNLVLHLCGNVRQWIIHGIGGEEDTRNRASEFSEREHIPKTELLLLMETTLREADQVLGRVDSSLLLEMGSIQKFNVTLLDALSHVVEHFAQHTAQIIYITKLRRGAVVDFFHSYFSGGEASSTK